MYSIGNLTEKTKNKNRLWSSEKCWISYLIISQLWTFTFNITYLTFNIRYFTIQVLFVWVTFSFRKCLNKISLLLLEYELWALLTSYFQGCLLKVWGSTDLMKTNIKTVEINKRFLFSKSETTSMRLENTTKWRERWNMKPAEVIVRF